MAFQTDFRSCQNHCCSDRNRPAGTCGGAHQCRGAEVAPVEAGIAAGELDLLAVEALAVRTGISGYEAQEPIDRLGSRAATEDARNIKSKRKS